jgi:serine/threonine-protein kinase
VSEDKVESGAAPDAPEASGTRGSISSPRPAPARQNDGEDPLIGKVIEDRVRIVRTIARGGMGKVYYAEQIALGRPCAVKVLDVRMAGGDAGEYARRFLLEASVSSKLTHPNVVTIFDYGKSEDGTCWLAMEYLEGKTLAQELKQNGRLAPDRAISIARQVCRALREAHALGVVHRDLKPGNVFLARHDDEGDFVKVLDFGLVKETHPDDGSAGAGVTQIGQVMGSPRYMAPEQVQGRPVDARTDIYALGCVMYAMLTGKPPFDKPNEMTTMMAHVSEPVSGMADVVPGLMLPEGLEGIVLKCLAKRPEDRFSSMEELLAALKLHGPMVSATTGSGVHVAAMMPPEVRSLVTSTTPEPTPRPSGSGKWIALVALLVLGAGGFLWWRSNSAGDEEPRPAASVTPPPLPTASTTASPTASAPPPVPTIKLRVETDPPGARVKEDDAEVCAATPCDIEYKGDQADGGIEHLLVIIKPHYKVEKKLVHAGGAPVVIKLRPN